MKRKANYVFGIRKRVVLTIDFANANWYASRITVFRFDVDSEDGRGGERFKFEVERFDMKLESCRGDYLTREEALSDAFLAYDLLFRLSRLAV